MLSSLLHILPVASLREGVLREEPGTPGVLARIGEALAVAATPPLDATELSSAALLVLEALAGAPEQARACGGYGSTTCC